MQSGRYRGTSETYLLVRYNLSCGKIVRGHSGNPGIYNGNGKLSNSSTFVPFLDDVFGDFLMLNESDQAKTMKPVEHAYVKPVNEM